MLSLADKIDARRAQIAKLVESQRLAAVAALQRGEPLLAAELYEQIADNYRRAGISMVADDYAYLARVTRKPPRKGRRR